jgi:hypothetical protein
MSENVGYATLNIIPSAKDFGNKLGDQVDAPLGAKGKSGGMALGGGILGGASAALGPIAGVMAGVFATGAIVSWGKAQVEALGRIEQINTQTASVIKSTGNAANVTAEGVEALAGKLEGLTGTEAESIQEGANLLLTFKNIRNEAGAGNDIFDQTTTAMVDMARAMGTDASSGAMQLGKALNDPVAGIAALSRVGITFSEDQKTLIKSLVESGQTMEAQKIILNELNSQFGGSGAAYAQTYAGKIDLLGHAWGTFGETLFTGVMPALGTAAVFLTRVTEVATGVIDILFNGNFDGGLFAALGTTEDSGIVDFLFNVRDLVIDLWSAIASGSPDGIAEVITGLIAGAAGVRDGVIGAILGALPGIVETILAMAPAILGAAVNSFLSLAQGLITAIPPLLSALLAMVPQIISLLLGMVPVLIEAGLSLFMGLVQAVIQVVPQIVTTLVTLIPQLATTLIGMLPTIITAALALFMGLVDGLVQMVPVLITAVLDLLPNLITTLLGMLPTIIDSAINLFLGIVTGLLKAIPQVIVSLLGMLPQLIGSLLGMIPKLLDGAVRLFTGIVSALPVVLPLIIDALIKIGPALFQALVGMVPILIRAGIDLIGGLVKGLFQAAGSVVDALLGIARGAVDAFKSFFGIHSPSRLFISFGGYMGEGLAIGLDRMQGTVTRSALDMANAAADAVSGVRLALSTDVSGSVAQGGLTGAVAAERAGRGSGGDIYHITEAVDAVATAQEVSRRQNARAA